MIPLRLQLKNFLSYGAQLQTIDFTPYSLICLSGKNGHGKSALLDAITWALWGQGRKISGAAKADSHLLRIGQDQMLVIFDFEFNSHHYRIRREFASSYGKQHASLDFGVIDNNQFKALTSKTIRETQHIIETTIGLDYDAFINSAFLRQGQSNEFSKKSPKERKEVLCSILGLNHFELLRKKAQDHVKNAQTELLHIQKFQEKYLQELNQLSTLQENISYNDQALKKIDEQEKQLHTEFNTTLQKKEELAAQKNEAQRIQQTQQKLLDQEVELVQKIKNEYIAWKKSHKQLLIYKNNDQLSYNDLLNKVNEEQKKLNEHISLKEKFFELKEKETQLSQKIIADHNHKITQIELSIKGFETDILNLNTKIADIKTQYDNDLIVFQEQQKQSNLISETLKSLQPLEKKHTQDSAIFEKRKIFYHKWLAMANILKNEYDTLQKKKKLTEDEKNPSCPLCEQNLSASRKKFLKNHFNIQEITIIHRLQRLSRLVKKLKPLLIEQHAALDQTKKDIEILKKNEFQLNELNNSSKVLQNNLIKYSNLMDNLQKELNSVQKSYDAAKIMAHSLKIDQHTILIGDHDYKVLDQLIHKIQKKIILLNFNQNHYQELVDQLSLLTNKQKDHDINSQTQLLNRHYHAITVLISQIRKIKSEIEIIKKQLRILKDFMQQEKEILTALATNNALVKELQKKKEILLHEKGSLQNQKLKLETIAKEYEKLDNHTKHLKNVIDDYQTIATAVSKDGIQALIIENALPEIEYEANQLLGQLTDNQSHIIIESLRDLKKGGTKETLEIKISDAFGIRPYELFSGGEAFRIDFSLRLAISKLLARRAGTSLQTLIIDEGFGSQDEEGLGHIMDALYKIQENFNKIIIVSHLPSMKNQFPVHFFVEKSSQGSTVHVIEQG